MWEIFSGLFFFTGLIITAIAIIILTVIENRQWWMWILLILGIFLLVMGAFSWFYWRVPDEDTSDVIITTQSPIAKSSITYFPRYYSDDVKM